MGVLEGALREGWLSWKRRKVLGYGAIDMMVIVVALGCAVIVAVAYLLSRDFGHCSDRASMETRGTLETTSRVFPAPARALSHFHI
jgi:hypothetical protein